MKTLRATFGKLTGLEGVLFSAVLAVILTYVYFFVLAPQHWALMDDYAFALDWGKPGFEPIRAAKEFMHNIMQVGRFRPLDALARVIRYGYLPVTPRAFHVFQLGLALVALSAFGALVQRATQSLARTFFALLLAAASLSMKDWIFYSTAAESLATTFLLIGMVLYFGSRRWLAVPFFVASFFSKETFFVLLLPFLSFEVLQGAQADRLSTWLKKLLPIGAMGVCALAFVIYVRSLPQLYTSQAGLGAHGFATFFTAFFAPLLKNFLPAILLVGYSLWKTRSQPFSRSERALLFAGLSIAVPYTLILAWWGPFDSWYYLHIPIPFGWAMILAALWRTTADAIESALVVGMISFLFVATLNGSRNINQMHEEAKLVARMACEDASRTPGLKIFSNCYEASGQLHNYLVLDRVCPSPPTFQYLGRSGQWPADVQPPYEIVSMKRCDAMDLSSIPRDQEFPFEWWTVLKKFSSVR